MTRFMKWAQLASALLCNTLVRGNMINQDPSHVRPGLIDPRNHYYLEDSPTRVSLQANEPLPTTSTGALRCAPNSPCLDGSCCGPKNLCGFGKDYCTTSCSSNCNATAPCGRDSAGGNIACGMNLCCSYYGWCGVTAEYCTPPPARGQPGCQVEYSDCQLHSPFQCDPGAASATKRSIGYYQGGNVYADDRQCNRIAPGQIKLNKYTHLYWAFAEIDNATHQVRPADPRDASLYYDFTVLRLTGQVKTWISIGGFDFTTKYPNAWTNMVSNVDNRRAFISSLVTFMDKYGFQVVDLDWEYPVDQKRGGHQNDMVNLVQLLKEMRATWGTKYGISLAIAPDIWYLQHYNAKGMLAYADWIGFMSYDLHGTWDADVPRIGKVVYGQTDLHDIEKDLLPLWYGLSPDDMKRVNFGLALYGRGYSLANPFCTRADGTCSWIAGSDPGICTSTEGTMSLTEIKDLITSLGLTPAKLDSGNGNSMMKQITWRDQWIGYDDEETVQAKINFASSRCFGGTMAWSVDLDNGEIMDQNDEDDGEPVSWTSCNKEYQELASLQSDQGNPPECINYYIIGVLDYILRKALGDYQKIIDNGYDGKFATFRGSIVGSLPNGLNNFIFKDPDKYFHCETLRYRECCASCQIADCLKDCDHSNPCTSGTSRKPEPCPRVAPNTDFVSGNHGLENGDWWWSFKDDAAKSAFYTDLLGATGIKESWLIPDQTIQSGLKSSQCNSPKPADCFHYWVGYFKTKKDIDLDNPKDIIGKALDKYKDVTSLLGGAQLAIQFHFTEVYDGTYVDAVSIPVLMAQSAITAMQSVVDTANELEEEARKEQILRFVGAVLFFIPVLGEAVDALGLTILSRIIAITGDIADEAFNLYGIVQDPSSAIFSLFGTLLKGANYAQAAKLRRTLKEAEVKGLGKQVNDDLVRIDDMRKVCPR